MASQTIETTTRQSTYSQFMKETGDLIDKKSTYQALLISADYYSVFDRSNIVKYAALLETEFIQEFIDIGTKSLLSSKLKRLEAADSAISNYQSLQNKNERIADNFQPFIDSAITAFKNDAYEFIKYYNKLLVRANISATPKEQKLEIQRFRETISAHPDQFSNPDGIPISMEMELWCRGLYLRAKHGWYNIVVIEGEPGVGKTTFTYAAASTLASMFGMKFDPFSQLLLNESRDYTEKTIAKLQKYGILVLDEGGNQLNAKTTYDESQLSLTNRMNLIRFMNLNIFVNWPYVKGLDSTFRNKQAQQIVSIQTRDIAIVRTLNKNPYAHDALTTPERYKDRQVDTHEEASMMLEEDMQTVLTIPFYSLPKAIEEPLVDRKLVAKNINKSLSTKSEANEFYTQFLCQLDPNAPEINDSMLDEFSDKVSYKLYMQPLIKRLCRATGQRVNDLWHSMSVADPYNKGSLTVNNLLSGYIRKLQAEKKGAQESPVEGNETS